MVYGQHETIFCQCKVRVGGEPETIYRVFVVEVLFDQLALVAESPLWLEVPLWPRVHESFVLN